MPWIDFVSSTDRVSLWYTTNSPTNNVSSFDRSKPTILMLHPLFLDSSWAHTQMKDPRLGAHYNMIALDVRSCGKSDARSSEHHDSWVDAADLAFAHQALQLPPVHLFAVSWLSCNAALRFAALFPEKLVSSTLVNACPPAKLDWLRKTYTEVIHMWCYPSDLDEFEHACLELSNLMLGDDVQIDLRDQLIYHWTLHYPPWRKRQIHQYVNTVVNLPFPKDEQLAAITTPTLFIQADKTHYSVKPPEEIAKKLVNVPDGAKVHIMRGAPEYVTVVPSCASIVNRVLASFVSQQPLVPSEVDKPPAVPMYERMQQALEKLAELSGDDSVASRDPRSAVSFSLATEEVRKIQLEAMKQHAITGAEFSPLGNDGRPLRKFSDRYLEHWFQESIESTTSTALVTQQDKERKLLKLEKLVAASDDTLASSTDGISSSKRSTGSKPMQLDHRKHLVRRSTVLKQTFEKASLGISDLPAMLMSNTVPITRV